MDAIQKELAALRDRCMSQDQNNAADVLNRVIELTAVVSSLALVVEAIHQFTLDIGKK